MIEQADGKKPWDPRYFIQASLENKEPRAMSNQELTRQVEFLRDIVILLAERVQALDGKAFFEQVNSAGYTLICIDTKPQK